MKIKEVLEDTTLDYQGMLFNDVDLDPNKIKAIMINEVVPAYATQDFYGGRDAYYLTTTIPLFQQAGETVETIQDILDLGIYITNAVKIPKTEYTVDPKDIERSLPFLQKEIELFPNLKVVMLMGDVAKKSYNKIMRKSTKKNIVPAISTYKLHNTEIYYQDLRIIPSYIMTGKNILIEKSKFKMASEDIAVMMEILK